MEFKKGQIQYYFNKFKTSLQIFKLTSIRDYNDVYGIGSCWHVDKELVGNSSFLGQDISANQLNGIGVSGAKDHIFDQHGIIERLFE